MKRREFIAGLGSAVAWPVVARGRRRLQLTLLRDGVVPVLG